MGLIFSPYGDILKTEAEKLADKPPSLEVVQVAAGDAFKLVINGTFEPFSACPAHVLVMRLIDLSRICNTLSLELVKAITSPEPPTGIQQMQPPGA